MPRIYISYRRADSADAAGRLYEKLVARFGKRNVYKDVDRIPLGSDLRAEIERKLIDCDVMLVVIGPHWLTVTDDSGKRRLDNPEDFVRIEVELGLHHSDVRVIPVLVDNTQMPSRDLPASLLPLAYKSAPTIRNNPDFERDVDRLIQVLAPHPTPKVFITLSILLVTVVLMVAFALLISIRNRLIVGTPTITATHTMVVIAVPTTVIPLPLTLAALERTASAATMQELQIRAVNATRTAIASAATETSLALARTVVEKTVTAEMGTALHEAQLTETAVPLTRAADETRSALQTFAASTSIALLWTPTPTVDARGTANARLTQTEIIIATTHIAESWTATPQPTATFTPSETRTPTPTASLTPMPTVTPSATATAIPTSSTQTQASTPTPTKTPNPTGVAVVDIGLSVRSSSGNEIGNGRLRAFYDDSVDFPETVLVELELYFDNLYITPTPVGARTVIPVTSVATNPELAATQPAQPTSTPRNLRYESAAGAIAIYQLMGASLRCLSSSFAGCNAPSDISTVQSISPDGNGTKWTWIIAPQNDIQGLQNLQLELWKLISVNGGPNQIQVVWDHPFQINVHAQSSSGIPEILNTNSLIICMALALVAVAIFVLWRKFRPQPQLSEPEKYIFLSYNRRGSAGYAVTLHDRLEQKGAQVFLDVEDMDPGSFPDHIEQNILKSDYFIVLLAPDTLKSEWVVREIMYAKEYNKLIIPVLINEFNLQGDEVTEELKFLQFLESVPLMPNFFNAAFEKLCKYVGLE